MGQMVTAMAWGLGNALGQKRGDRKMKWMNNRYGNAMRLQIFVEEAETGTEAEEEQGEGEANAAEKGSAFDTFLKDPANQAEFDKRIAKALAKQEANLSAANQEALEKAKSEAEKLAQMSADQKKEYELEQLKAENEKLKAESMRSELGRSAASLLKEAKIDATTEMLDFVVGKDAEDTKARIDKFVSIIRAQVKASEVERATGTTPKNYGGGECSPRRRG